MEEDDTLYIYFQGSNQITDWVRNFLFKKRPYKDMELPYYVHRGFLNAWKEVEDIVINKIMELDNTGLSSSDILSLCMPQSLLEHQKLQPSIITKHYRWKHIIVVGYSHGGALAGLCHECVWFRRPDLRGDPTKLVGYGFEAPRFYGGYEVKPELRERWETFTVIRNNNDIVTHCPPWIFAYAHVGSMLQIHGNITSVTDKVPNCVKAHYPEPVKDGLVKYEASIDSK